jgi:hypothetical protein
MACYTLTSLFRVNEPYLVYNEALAKRMKLRKYALARELAVQRSFFATPFWVLKYAYEASI